MTERHNRRASLLLVAALLFLGIMFGFYLWATQPPQPLEMRSSAVPSSPPPTERADKPVRVVRPAPVSKSPSRRQLPPPNVEAPTEAPRDPLAPVELDIKVVDDAGEPIVRVPVRIANAQKGSNTRRVTDENGTVIARVAPGLLSLVAERADGMLVSRSDPVELDASEGGNWSVELVISSEPKGGLGVGIQPHPEGVKVLSVHDGTPAAEAGLVVGDVIVAVEGEETAGMPLPEFIAQMTGEIGTKVLFDIVRDDGSEERLQVERALIERRNAGNRQR